MDRTPVSSSNIVSIGYDPDTSTLEVEFKGGAVYHYFNVPENIHVGLMAAASHGTYLNKYVKGTYKYSKL